MEIAARTGPVFEKIGLSRLDLSNHFFKITGAGDFGGQKETLSPIALKSSISRLGLMSPPILKAEASGHYLVVSGFKRIAACRDSGWREIPAFVFDPETDDGLLMRLAIADNAFHRPLDVVEQAAAVSKLLPYLPADKASWTAQFQEIGLDIHPGMIDKLRKIHGAATDLKAEMASGNISLTVGLELMEMDAASGDALLMIFKALHPTLNHQKEMIRMARDIAGREEHAVSRIIEALGISAIVHDPDADRNLKITRIRQKLKGRRYPEIAAFETTYQERCGRLSLPESLRLYPPPDFEGNDFSMQIRFRNLSEFNGICENLSALRNHPDFAAILEKT